MGKKGILIWPGELEMHLYFILAYPLRESRYFVVYYFESGLE